MTSDWKPRVRQAGRIIAKTGLWLLVWFGMTLLITSLGLRMFFGKITLDQLLFNVIALRVDGGGGELVWLGIVGVLIVPALLTWLLARIYARPSKVPRSRIPALRITALLVAASVTLFGSTAFVSTVKLGDYVRSADESLDLGDFYVEPSVTLAEDPHNLILIYLESVETALGDEEIFGKDMLAPVKEATEGWESIDHLAQYAGGGWTMAGLVGTQCGIPLKGKISVEGSQLMRELVTGIDSYLPGVTCLGDVLADHGYRNVFLGGSDASFAAKRVFLADHGYDTIRDLNDWRATGEEEVNIRSDWGLSDARLMEHARDEVAKLQAHSRRTGAPFHLTLLTLDTHEPVHPYPSCTTDEDADMSEVYRCSMEAVAEFIEWLSTEGYLEDTAVVVMGDHLKQLGVASSFTDELESAPSRTIFNRIWIPDRTPQTSLRDSIDQLSMYPTILEIAGFTVREGVAGVGTSAFTPVPDNSAPNLDQNTYRELLQARSSEFYRAAWQEQ